MPKQCKITEKKSFELVHIDDIAKKSNNHLSEKFIMEIHDKPNGKQHFNIDEKQFVIRFYHPRHPLMASTLRRKIRIHSRPASFDKTWITWGI